MKKKTARRKSPPRRLTESAAHRAYIDRADRRLAGLILFSSLGAHVEQLMLRKMWAMIPPAKRGSAGFALARRFAPESFKKKYWPPANRQR
jgi:hypothetical protein